jgi:RNase H-fold protein (predicted Holliday junction resolvase)
MQAIIGIDPGREKCGFAVLKLDGSILCRKVIETEKLTDKVQEFISKCEVEKIIMGNGTTSRTAAETIKKILPPKCELKLVDEYRTTDMARRRYFCENPPRGLKRFLPKGMLYPPEPVDDYVAVILVERYIAGKGR